MTIGPVYPEIIGLRSKKKKLWKIKYIAWSAKFAQRAKQQLKNKHLTS